MEIDIKTIVLDSSLNAIDNEGNLTLKEKQVLNIDHGKIIVRIDTRSGQDNRPHVHICYSDGSVYPVSIDNDIELLHGKEDGKYRYARKNLFSDSSIQLYRKMWNQYLPNAPYKFIKDPATGRYLCK